MWRFLKGKRHSTASVPLYMNCRTAIVPSFHIPHSPLGPELPTHNGLRDQAFALASSTFLFSNGRMPPASKVSCGMPFRV